MKDMNFSLADFASWLESYNQNKRNEQSFAIRNFPARIFRKTIDLTTAQELVTTGLPFNGCQVEKIYNTATGLSVDGNVRLNIDRGTIDKASTFKKLFENDSFDLGFSAANGFLSWDAQPGVSIDLVFFNDIFFKSGSQKTSISGQVSVSNTAGTTLYTKEVPALVTRLALEAAGNSSYVVPAGFRAKIYFACSGGGTGAMRVTVGGTKIYDSQNALPASLNVTGQSEAIAGETVRIDQTGGAIDWIYCQIVNYPI